MAKTINRLSWSAEKFLKDNLDLVDTELEEFYKKLRRTSYGIDHIYDTGNLTHFFLENGINPLSQMSKVPPNYLGGEYAKWVDPIRDLIPSNISIIGEDAFKELWWSTIYIPSNVKIIEQSAFYESYLHHIELSEGLKTIGRVAFAHSNMLEEVNIPNSVEEMGFRCFYECDSLKKVTIGSNVKDLNNAQFDFCMNLQEVTYNNTVQHLKEILGNCFADCYKLKEIKCTDGVYQII